MPGPGKKSKSKQKKAKAITAGESDGAESTRPIDVRPLKIDNEESWNIVMNMISEIYDIPDLTTRSGLKRVYNNFEEIYRRLYDAYRAYPHSDKLHGGIVCIFATMSVDAVLSSKLIEKGFLQLLLPLLDLDLTRHLALRALVRMSHHGGSKIRTEIAKHANKLAKLLDAFPDDARLADFAVSTISHCVSEIVNTRDDNSEKPNEPAILKSLDMPLILRAVIDATKREFPESKSILGHAVSFIAMATTHASKSFYQTPGAIEFLIAGMRSTSWVTRCTCLSGIIRLHALDGEKDRRLFDPNAWMAAVKRGPPDHLIDVLMDYGHPRTEIFMALNATKDFQDAMMETVQTGDLYALGLRLATLILRTEFSVPGGMFQTKDPRTGKLKPDNCGLPFTLWSDSLTHCARAIRNKGRQEDLDAADILEIKDAIMKQKIPEAVKIAKKGIERNPQCAYFYYALTLSADNVQGLKAAKQGMKCRNITPFVRFQMMQRAVEHAGTMGLNVFQVEMPDGGKRYEEGLAFLMSAMDDAKAYVEQAPPDNRHMLNVGYWYLLLTVLTMENLSPDLKEIQSNIIRLNFADEFSAFVKIVPAKTAMRLAAELVIRRYTTAIKTFGPVFARADSMRHGQGLDAEHSHHQLEENLAAWVEDANVKAPGEYPQKWVGDQPVEVNFEHVTLYRCNYCGNPSAVLRKCAGCGKSRYCEVSCQKAHWPEHKKACKSSP